MWTGGWYGGWDGDWFGDEDVGGSSASLSATGGSGSFGGSASSPAVATLGATGGSGAFSGSASVSGPPVDVRVSWLAFDTAAAPCDVRVSWLCHDTAATPYDVRVSWLCFDTAAPRAASTGFIEVGGGMTRAKAAALMRDDDDGDADRITRQNQLILALVTAAVTEGLLV